MIMTRQTVDLSKLQTIVLDEADEMLNMGFLEDITWIIERCPENCQRACFRRPWPTYRKTHTSLLNSPEVIRIKPAKTTQALITQTYLQTEQHHKRIVLEKLLTEDTEAVWFSRTKTSASEIASHLQTQGYRASALHDDMTQPLRERVIQQVMKKAVNILVATDVAARGLDIQHISHVINFDLPTELEA